MYDYTSHPTKGAAVLLDANLLVLLCVGRTDENLIRRHKRTKAFVEVDYRVLEVLLSAAKAVMTTQPILTEASNLLGDRKRTGTPPSVVLRDWIVGTDETNVASSELAGHRHFVRLGLCDSAICTIAKEQSMRVLTADRPLWEALAAAKIDAVNFHFLRNEWIAPGASGPKWLT